MRIRPEAPGDVEAIARLVERAFAGEPHSSHTEQFIVRALRKAGALCVSLVAEHEQNIVGHVAYSQVAISDGSSNWYGLGPLAVEPAFQRQGIGSHLVRSGLVRLQAIQAAGCVVLGDPQYYARFGFQRIGDLVYPGPPPEYFLARVFAGAVPQGQVSYHEAFASEA